MIGGVAFASVSAVFGVGQPASETTAAKSGPFDLIASRIAPSGERTPLCANDAVVVGHPASASATVRLLLSVFPAALLPFCAGVPAIGVGQPANHATRPSNALLGAACSCPSFQSRGGAGGQEPKPLPDVRSTEARSAQICRPNGVARNFQVSENKVEPTESVFARNLFAKHD